MTSLKELQTEREKMFDEKFNLFTTDWTVPPTITQEVMKHIKSYNAETIKAVVEWVIREMEECKKAMQDIKYPKPSIGEDEKDYWKRKRGFKIGKSKFVSRFCALQARLSAEIKEI